MKKTLAYFLAAAMLLTLTACGQGDKSVGSVSAAVSSSQSAAASASAEDAQPEFDNSWASNEFEQQLTQPDFADWSVAEYTEGTSWTIFVKGEHYAAVKAYADQLRTCGFDRNEAEGDQYEGLAYTFEADNAAGYHARLVFEAINTEGIGNFQLTLSK